MDNRLNQHWDACIVGNGISSLWLFALLSNRGLKTLWVSSEAPCDSARAFLQRGWLWNVSPETAAAIAAELRPGTEFLPFESAYYDAKTSKRIRRLGEIKHEWGEHEAAYFEALMASNGGGSQLDLWDLNMAAAAVARDSVRLEGWPVTEIRTAQKEGERKVDAIVLASLPPAGDVYTIHANQFFFGDYAGFLPSLVSEKSDAEVLASALKGKASSAGFGLHLIHKPLGAVLQQTLIVPLVANPSDKSTLSHLTGRFLASGAAHLESFWIGFLSSEEVEDNNEILKKIKLAKRAAGRAIPGFAASVVKESVTFEPRMFAVDLLKARKNVALGAKLFTDQFGPEAAIRGLLKILPESRC